MAAGGLAPKARAETIKAIAFGIIVLALGFTFIFVPGAPLNVSTMCTPVSPFLDRIKFLEWKLSLIESRPSRGIQGPIDQKCLQANTLWEFGLAPRPESGKGGTYASQTGAEIFGMLRFNQTHPVWTKDMWTWYQQRLATQATVSVPDYPHSAEDLLMAYCVAPTTVQNATAAVFSAITPWTESTLHHYGAAKIFTVDYNVPFVEDGVPITPLAFSELYATRKIIQFDSIVSFSGVEHDGNGRYGDPLNPNGDISALKEMWHFLKPNGVLFLGIPLDVVDHNVFPWHRLYGPTRLRELIKPYTLIAYVWDGKTYPIDTDQFPLSMFQRPSNIQDWQYQPVLVLQKRPQAL